jgi:hypothetical protein
MFRRLGPADVARLGRLHDVHRGDVQLRSVRFAVPVVAAQHVADEHVGVRVAVVGGDDGGDFRARGGRRGGGSQRAGGEEGSTFHG